MGFATPPPARRPSLAGTPPRSTSNAPASGTPITRPLHSAGASGHSLSRLPVTTPTGAGAPIQPALRLPAGPRAAEHIPHLPPNASLHQQRARQLLLHWTSGDDPKQRFFWSWQQAIAAAMAKVQPKKVLFLGGAGMGKVADYAERKAAQGKQRTVVGTELRTEEELLQDFPAGGGDFVGNRQRILAAGGQVHAGVNAMALDPETLGTDFDKVKFEFPRTERPNVGSVAEQYQALRSQDKALMKGTFASAKGVLKTGGSLQISEGGFPYRGQKEGVQALDLAKVASKAGGFSAPAIKELGAVTVERTHPGALPIQFPTARRHRFRYQPV